MTTLLLSDSPIDILLSNLKTISNKACVQITLPEYICVMRLNTNWNARKNPVELPYFLFH